MIFTDISNRNGFKSIVQIRGDVRCVLGEEVYYRLYEIKRAGIRSYAINVSCKTENEIYSFGCDRVAVIELYSKIVKYSVTPCTLKDIAEDYQKQIIMSRGKKRY